MYSTQIKFLQINLKHPRTATNNVMKIIDEDGTDVLCIQEPNVIPNKIAGIPRKHKIYASGEERHRAAIVVTNNQIDFLLLRQLSDEDTVVLEVVSNKARTIIASIADTLAKAAATNLDIAECYNKVPKSLVKRELEDRSVDKWQRDGNRSTKGKIIKDYYPTVAERLKMKITTTHNFTTMVTGHGNINAYLYRFKISETPTCPCGDTDQTTDHLLYECELLKKQRDTLRSIVPKSEGWPTSKHTHK